MKDKGIMLNKYGALTDKELKELFERIENLEAKLSALTRLLGFKAGFDYGNYIENFEKMMQLTHANDYEFITEIKLINKKQKEKLW